MQKIVAYLDGSCIGNPGPGSFAIVFLDEKEEFELGRIVRPIEQNTTNNRMELEAIAVAFEKLFKFNNAIEVVIASDSTYAIGAAFETQNGSANRDLVSRSRQSRRALLERGFKVESRKVPAHSDDHWNNLVDELAREAALGNLPATEELSFIDSQVCNPESENLTEDDESSLVLISFQTSTGQDVRKLSEKFPEIVSDISSLPISIMNLSVQSPVHLSFVSSRRMMDVVENMFVSRGVQVNVSLFDIEI